MKIVMARAFDFPVGGASQNRALSIFQGLIAQGHKVDVHVFCPGKLPLEINKKPQQTYNGVNVFNHVWSYIPATSAKRKYFGLLKGVTSACKAIWLSHKKEKIDYLFINSNKTILVIPFYLLSRLMGVKFVRELNEFPNFELFKGRTSKARAWIQKRTNYLWFDVVLVMTKLLLVYYKELIRKDIPTFHLPMTVDLSRFANTVDNLAANNSITYCGDLSQQKDGVITLIKAFALINQKFPQVKLTLIGANHSQEYTDSLKQLVDKLGINDKVIFTGRVAPEQVVTYLYKARVLVLSRPNNLQAQGGFPTKLGEYLATGVPVAVTKVGEIPDYLQDEVSAYLAEPDSIDSFAMALERALVDDNKAAKVGMAGRKVAEDVFSHLVQGKRLSDFLQQLTGKSS